MLLETPKWFDEAVDWLTNNRRRIIQDYIGQDQDLSDIASDFEFPDYAGMPKKLSCKMPPDFVDCVQMQWQNYLCNGEPFKKNNFIQDLLGSQITLKPVIKRKKNA